MSVDIEKIPTQVIRSNRKTISIELKMSGLIVRAPYQMKQHEVHAFLLKKQAWIENHYARLQERQLQLQQLTPFTEEEIRAFAEKAMVVIPEKIQHYAPIVGVDYGRITIRNQRSRWGSCSSKGNLNFNCLLMLLPDNVIDSVVVHELCHRKHMDHSVRFYAEVERVFPEYQKCQKWLKENGSTYLSRLP